MKDLEKLLNKFIGLGWKPWESNYDIKIKFDWDIRFMVDGDSDLKRFSLNDLCSIDSGLWSYIVDNNLHKNKPNIENYNTYETLLMQSALSDNKEDFILSNVII